ncbi:hypothetical protein, partial [Pseudomonas aeruginosa]
MSKFLHSTVQQLAHFFGINPGESVRVGREILQEFDLKGKYFIFHRKVKTTGFQPVSFSATMRGWRASAWITDTAVIRST